MSGFWDECVFGMSKDNAGIIKIGVDGIFELPSSTCCSLHCSKTGYLKGSDILAYLFAYYVMVRCLCLRQVRPKIE